MQKDTVSIYFIRSAVAHLAADVRERVLRATGIAPELLQLPHARVPAGNFAALWMTVAGELDDEFFGLDTRRMKVGSFALLCHSLLVCADLEQALKAITRGFALFLDDVCPQLEVHGDTAVVAIDNRIAAPADRLFADETMLVMVHGLACWLIGKRIELRAVAFAGPRPPHAAEYALMFSPLTRFGAERAALHFDARLLRARTVQDVSTLRSFLRDAPQSVFLKFRNTDSWTARLRRRLRPCIGGDDWPLQEQLAAEFHVTLTTLRRRLEAEGTNYQALKDDLRRDAAVHYLCNTGMSVTDVAGQLCFQDASAFRRAFKKWTGMQPVRYRVSAGSVGDTGAASARPRTTRGAPQH